MLSIGRVVGGVSALGWTLFAARRLQNDWGRLSTILAYASVASVLTDLGIPLALVQLSCRHRTLDRTAILHAIRRRALVGSVASIALVLAWQQTSTSEGRWGLAALYGISVTVTPVTGSLLALLRGRAIGVVEACYEAGRQLALPAIGITLVQLGFGVYAVLASYVFIDATGALIVYAVAHRRLGLSAEHDASESQELQLRQTLPLSATTIVGNAYERVDSALLAPLAGTASVGLYRMISPVIGAALMPARAFGDAAAVAAGRVAPGEKRAVCAKFIVRALLVTAPLALLMAIAGPVVLPHVLHTHATASSPHPLDWSKAAAPLRVLALAAIPTGILATLTPVAVISRRDRVFAIALTALVMNIALNLALVPSWGADMGVTGAATAFLITEVMLCAILWTGLPKRSAVLTAQPTSA